MFESPQGSDPFFLQNNTVFISIRKSNGKEKGYLPDFFD